MNVSALSSCHALPCRSGLTGSSWPLTAKLRRHPTQCGLSTSVLICLPYWKKVGLGLQLTAR